MVPQPLNCLGLARDSAERLLYQPALDCHIIID
jgi:hypothetical protein